MALNPVTISLHSREVAQIGREGTEDGILPVLVGFNAGAEVLEGLVKRMRDAPRSAGEGQCRRARRARHVHAAAS